MDYDIMYIDDARNAVRDHRPQSGSRPAMVWGSRPVSSGSRTVVVPPGARPTVITTGASSPAAGYIRPQVVYGQPQLSLASRFGMTTGELIDTAIQVLAALQPLPAAPTAQGEAGVDVENLVTYQGALWQHAKRDEQLRTLGSLLARILQ